MNPLAEFLVAFAKNLKTNRKGQQCATMSRRTNISENLENIKDIKNIKNIMNN